MLARCPSVPPSTCVTLCSRLYYRWTAFYSSGICLSRLLPKRCAFIWNNGMNILSFSLTCACAWVNDCSLVYICAPACLCACVPLFRCLFVCAFVCLCVYTSVCLCVCVCVCVIMTACSWVTHRHVCWRMLKHKQLYDLFGRYGAIRQIRKGNTKETRGTGVRNKYMVHTNLGNNHSRNSDMTKKNSPIIIAKSYQTTFIRLSPATVPNLLLTQYLIYNIPDMSHFRRPSVSQPIAIQLPYNYQTYYQYLIYYIPDMSHFRRPSISQPIAVQLPYNY